MHILSGFQYFADKLVKIQDRRDLFIFFISNGKVDLSDPDRANEKIPTAKHDEKLLALLARNTELIGTVIFNRFDNLSRLPGSQCPIIRTLRPRRFVFNPFSHQAYKLLANCLQLGAIHETDPRLQLVCDQTKQL